MHAKWSITQFLFLVIIAHLTMYVLSSPTTTSDKCPLQLYEEYVSENETATIDDISRLLTSSMSARPCPRAQFQKDHGCIYAEFSVLPESSDLAVGLFAKKKTYSSIIRFSSAGGPEIPSHILPDTQPDIRGLSIKLLHVRNAGQMLLPDEKQATTMDFVFVNSPFYFIDNVNNYHEYVTRSLNGTLDQYFLRNSNHQILLQEMTNLNISNPLYINWYSVTPYRFGSKAVKYVLLPCARESGNPVTTDDGFRSIVKSTLARQSACFNLYVQFQIDPCSMPIEDATMEWDPIASPTKRIAQIRIPKQVQLIESSRCNQLSFTPWHTTTQHKPLGGINRLRLHAYKASSILRHRINNSKRQEPTVLKPVLLEKMLGAVFGGIFTAIVVLGLVVFSANSGVWICTLIDRRRNKKQAEEIIAEKSLVNHQNEDVHSSIVEENISD